MMKNLNIMTLIDKGGALVYMWITTRDKGAAWSWMFSLGFQLHDTIIWDKLGEHAAICYA